jgi:hypothetical protein
MNRQREIPWLRILAEGTIIVVSILLAFWIDTWWETNKEREFRQTLLSSLLEELNQVQARLDYQEIYFNAIRGSARRLVIAGISPDTDLGDREIDKLLFEICFYSNRGALEAPELAAIVSGGYQSLIRDAELRILISSWSASLEKYRSSVKQDFDFFNNTQVRYLMRHADLAQIYTASDKFPGHPDKSWPIENYEIDSPSSHANIIRDKEFRNIVTERINLIANIVDLNNQSLHDDLARIIAGVERELRR